MLRELLIMTFLHVFDPLVLSLLNESIEQLFLFFLLRQLIHLLCLPSTCPAQLVPSSRLLHVLLPRLSSLRKLSCDLIKCEAALI